MFCPDAIHFVSPVACLLSPCSQTANSSCCSRDRKASASILSRDSEDNDISSKFGLVLVVITMCPEFCPLRQLAAHVSGAPQLFCAGLFIGIGTVYWRLGVKIILFSTFKTKPPIPEWKMKYNACPA